MPETHVQDVYIRDAANTKWISFCDQDWRVRNAANNAWLQMHVDNTKVRNSTNTGWLQIMCGACTPKFCIAGRLDGTPGGLIDRYTAYGIAGFNDLEWTEATFMNWVLGKIRADTGLSTIPLSTIELVWEHYIAPAWPGIPYKGCGRLPEYGGLKFWCYHLHDPCSDPLVTFANFDVMFAAQQEVVDKFNARVGLCSLSGPVECKADRVDDWPLVAVSC